MTEELEKEADESARKFFGKPTDLVDLDNLRIFKYGYLDGAEPRDKRIEELETRCTELFLQNNEFAEQLEKAKEILKDLLLMAKIEHLENRYESVTDAEQFLKE